MIPVVRPDAAVDSCCLLQRLVQQIRNNAAPQIAVILGDLAQFVHLAFVGRMVLAVFRLDALLKRPDEAADKPSMASRVES